MVYESRSHITRIQPLYDLFTYHEPIKTMETGMIVYAKKVEKSSENWSGYSI